MRPFGNLLACAIAISAATLIAAPGTALPAHAQNGDAETSDQDQAPQMPELPPAEFDETLSVGGDEIEARQLRSRMTVEVNINGTGPHRFVVDSGADTSVIGRKLAAELELPGADPVLLHSMTESTMVDRAQVDTLELGPSMVTNLELPVLKEAFIGGDGMIGLDALVEQRLMLDFDERIITVEDRYDEPVDFGRNEIIVTGRLQRGQLILTEVKAQGHEVDAIIDTGTEVTIGNLALKEELIRRSNRDDQTFEIFGVTGASAEIEFAIVHRLQMGPVTFSNVPIAFADVPPFEVFGINDKPSLLLGTDLMETFRRVSLDFAERKVRFQLKKCGSQLARVRTIKHATRLRAQAASACER
ncbi:aspartyl protease family protein [uncultured Erythrobacter sp.]|uniref:aspartyl protease family protein n=1 Tax=uncultured Erythrobacter sp. TaxID=263913 RepID=UPI002615D0F4|nr:aspartyl protease family protein [uncultured Erythrobacter sp.]